MTARRYGAKPSDWDALTLFAGLTADLLPVVSNPRAEISDRSSIKDIGKTPSLYDRHGKVVGLSDWTHRQSTPADVDKWSAQPDYGICIQTRELRALDVDVDDAELAAKIEAHIRTALGDAPARRRPNSGKFLIPFRMPGEFKKKRFLVAGGAVEFLAAGQQFIAVGTHPSGVAYEWDGGLPDDFVDVDPGALEALWNALKATFGVDQAAVPDQLAVSAPDVANLDELLSDDGRLPWLTDPKEAVKLLKHFANPAYDVWFSIIGAFHHQSGIGSDPEAWFKELDDWSSQQAEYKGTAEVRMHWNSCGRNKNIRAFKMKSILRHHNFEEKKEGAKALTYAKERITGAVDLADLVDQAAGTVGEAAKKGSGDGRVLEELFRERYKALSPSHATISITETRALLYPEKESVAVRRESAMANYSLSEFGNTERMLDMFGADLMYVAELGQWYVWDYKLTRWRKSTGIDLEMMGKEAVRSMVQELGRGNSRESQETIRHCLASMRAPAVANMITLARSDLRVTKHAAQLDADPFLFGVANGTVDLRTGALLEPNPEHLITIASSVAYDVAATCPLFEQTVLDVFSGDAEMAAFFQRVVGYAMLGQPNEDVIVIPWGSGSNGKSTVLGAIREVFGEHARATASETFLTTGAGAAAGAAGGPREDVLRLRGSRMAYVTEPDEGSELREGLIKSMTGGEPIPARGIHAKATIEVQPTWVAFMPTNHKPIVKGDDYAIWRRLLLIPFTRNFDKDPSVTKDLGRAEKLRTERSGILRWCVEGAMAYQALGFARPGVVVAALEKYRNDMDLLREWIDTCCETGPGKAASCKDLFASWKQFSELRGELRLISSSRRLAAKLLARGFDEMYGSGNVAMRAGICIKSQNPDDNL